MLERFQLAGAIIGVLAFFAGLIAKWTLDRRDTKESKDSIKDLTSTLRKVSADLSETKWDTKESNRLLTAVHRRMDTVEKEQRDQRDIQVRHDTELQFLKENLKTLRETQKIRPTE